MDVKRHRETTRLETSRRLRETRLALGYDNATKYAREAGIGGKTYLNYENGYRPGLREAIKLCEHYHLSLDWIYFGEPSALLSMPADVVDKIRNYKSVPSTKPQKRSPFQAAE